MAHPIQLDELVIAAKNLKKNATPGSDGINNRVIQCFALHRPELLIRTYNKCLVNGYFPKCWKTARLVLLRKGDKPLNIPSSYRPLCILDCPGKLLEKIIDNRLRTFLEANIGLDQRQYGFRKGRSTTDAINTLREIIKNSGPKKKIGVLTLDIKNAFNSAPWKAIMEAMQHKDVPMYICRIIGSYLENRTLLVNSGGSEKTVELSSGVPQGSVLGPTLWNIMYEGLLQNRLPVGASFLAFADVVAVVAVANNTLLLSNILTAVAETVRIT